VNIKVRIGSASAERRECQMMKKAFLGQGLMIICQSRCENKRAR